MPETTCTIGPITAGPSHPLLIIAGPCVLEDAATNRLIAREMSTLCATLGLPFIFKASFDKANRSSIRSARGPGLERGLAELAAIKNEFAVPVTTDVHLPEQAGPAAAVADLLQIPAFLCRQTDLLVACARTGTPVNVKKGQFLAPADMRHVVTKVREAGGTNLMLTERGTFFGYHRLVNDFVGLSDMMALGPPVCFDVTHSTQLPGADAERTGGRPDAAPLLTRCAVVAGVHALFIECHPDPPRAASDATTQQPLDAMEQLLRDAMAVRASYNPRPMNGPLHQT